METAGKRANERKTQAMTFRLTEEARGLLIELAQKNGISMAAMLELLIRRAAKED